MKKSYLLALGLAAAISFWGINAISPYFRKNPAAVAQTGNNLAIAAEVKPDSKVNAIFVYPTNTPPPTITPNAPRLIVYPTPIRSTSIAHPVASPTPASPIVDAAAEPVATAEATEEALSTTDQTALDRLIDSVSNNQPSRVAGVFVPGKLSLPVIQQPDGDLNYVSTQNGTVTQFGKTSTYGTIGLLAHDFLSGAQFFQMNLGDNVYIVYGNGGTEQYRINRIDRFQALSPNDIYSNFIDLADPSGTTLSSSQVFYQEYANGNQVVFQTCIEANGDPSWGRIFIVADKITGS